LAAAAWLSLACGAGCTASGAAPRAPEAVGPAPGKSPDWTFLDGAASRQAPVEEVRFFTSTGRDLVQVAARIVVGRVRASHQLPIGPRLLTVDVAQWLKTGDPRDARRTTITVSTPLKDFRADQNSVLLFLGTPKTAADEVQPMLAAAVSNGEEFQCRVDWVTEDLRIAQLEPYMARVAATRVRMFQSLQSKYQFERAAMLREVSYWVDSGSDVVLAEHAPELVKMAGRATDREFALALVDVAGRITKRAR
jgi:hypothetical protein